MSTQKRRTAKKVETVISKDNKSKNQKIKGLDKTTEDKEAQIEVKGIISNSLRENSLKESGLSDLAKFLTGEMELEKKQKEVKKLKDQAIKRQKEMNRIKIQKGELILEREESEFDPSISDDNKKIVQKLTLFKWTAPIRLKFSYDNKTFLTAVALSLVFILYLALLGHYGLMFALIALLFFIYVAGTTEAIDVEHMITTRGIESFEKLYEWHMLGEFWFSKKNDQYILIVDTKLRVPSKLMMLVDESDLTTLFLLLQDKLLYKDIKRYSFIDSWAYGEYIGIEDI